MEWFLWFDGIAILGMVVLLGLVDRRESTPRRESTERSSSQRERAEGKDPHRGAATGTLRAEGKPQPS